MPHINSPHYLHEALTSLIATGCAAGMPPSSIATKLMHELPWHGWAIKLREGGRLRKPIDRFLTKFTPEPNTGCWLWLGSINSGGYGSFSDYSNGSVPAHVWSYKAFRGSIRKGWTIDHLCGEPSCVNPEHLESVTRGKNSERMQATRALARAQVRVLAQAHLHLRGYLADLQSKTPTI